jgi:hypothetical protein
VVGAALPVAQVAKALADAMPRGSCPWVLQVSQPSLLLALLRQPVIHPVGFEVPAAWWTQPALLSALMQARAHGHTLYWQGALAQFGAVAKQLQGIRGILSLSPDEASLAQQAAAQKGEFLAASQHQWVQSPIKPGHFYEALPNRALAAHALDKRQASGIVGWPPADLQQLDMRQPLPMDQLVMSQVTRLTQTDVALHTLEEVILKDPGMAYRLLRLINSAGYGLEQPIQSIRHALMMLGYDRLRQWLMQSKAQTSTDLAWHPVRQAMHWRTRIMQSLLDAGSGAELKGEIQMTAAFSQLDQIMHAPLPELLRHVPLSSRITSSILSDDGPYSSYLAVMRVLAQPTHVHQLATVCAKTDVSLAKANVALMQSLAPSM